ncbi:MAG: hypothetical protein GY953_19490, partial [bacterium]|nr:hypothetical protein [bacterium]
MLAPFVAVLILVCAVLPAAWHVIRRKGFYRWEPAVLCGTGVAIGLVWEPRGTLAVLWLGVAACAVGRFGLDRLKLRFASPIASTAIASAGGLALFAYLMFFLGLAGLYHRWIFAALLAAPCIVFHRQLRVSWNELRRISRRWGEVAELQSPLASLSVTV